MHFPLGIGDASSYDTSRLTDWNIAKRHGVEFGIVRACTTGAWINGKPSIIEDTMFAMNTAKMINAGVKRMPYAWFDPRYKVCNPVEQAMKFVEILDRNGGPGELGPMIDLEDAPAAGIYNFIGDWHLYQVVAGCGRDGLACQAQDLHEPWLRQCLSLQ